MDKEDYERKKALKQKGLEEPHPEIKKRPSVSPWVWIIGIGLAVWLGWGLIKDAFLLIVIVVIYAVEDIFSPTGITIFSISLGLSLMYYNDRR
jgi:hypothetical protein